MLRTSLFRSIAVGCTALVLAACGGTGAGTGTGPGGDPVPGGTAQIIQISEPRTLDPVALGNQWVINAMLGNALYGTLMVNNPESGKIDYTMATGFATHDGGTTFDLTLRPDLRFTDGTPLDAAAVKYNWDRFPDPANGSSYAEDAAVIAATEVVNPTTLRVRMHHPVPHFAYTIVESSMNWIASPQALQAGRAAFDRNPVGAGPFTLQRWARQDVIELVENPQYWDAPKPYLDRIELRTSGDSVQGYNTLISGGSDVIISSNWGSIEKLKNQGFPTAVAALHGGQHLSMNMRRAPFDDIRARRAVAAAIDVNALNLTIYHGSGELPTTLFRESSPYYAPDLPLQTHDPETAQRLFDELAAEGKPVKFTYTTTAQTENRLLAESVQAQLSAFDNIEVEVKVIDIIDLIKLRYTHDFDVMTGGAFFDDPEPRLWTAFHGDSSRNTAGIDDAVLNQALDTGRTSTDVEQRIGIYRTVQERLIELMPAVFYIRTVAGAATAKNVGGLTMYGAGSVRPEELWIVE
ncbi:ABC transporter substrate-binding protein [Nocardia carnea]|uniref:ABC transporter substrate-binding protein n=1 Tax=Nocardia carnea TaxID=37328 RepID=UPI002455A67B|nr:ABC transporter substrate-binding protein [Nocardia carnea]